MLTKSRVFTFLLSCSLSMQLSAQEIGETSAQEQSHTSYTRLNAIEHKFIQERRIKDHEIERAKLHKTRLNTETLSVNKKAETEEFLQEGPLTAQNEPLHPYHLSSQPSFHSLQSIADDDLSLEIEDGSHWQIADPQLLRTWRKGDQLIITPDYSWFSSYDYYIINKSTDTYIKANLYIGPFIFGSHSNWVIDIDHFVSHLYLQDGTSWCVNPKDQQLLKYWAINDHIIVGKEDTLWSYYDRILINVNLDEYVRVKQY